MTPPSASAAARQSLIDVVTGRPLVVVTGKGGVGKSTIAAALASSLARRGSRTLLLEIDPRESQHQLLGCEPSDGRVIRVGSGLLMQNADAEQVVGELVSERVPIRMLVDRIRRGSAFRQVVAGAPGLKELAVLYHASRLVDGHAEQVEGGVDTVVLDAPATGHGLGLLRAPALVADVIHGGPVRDIADKLATSIRDPRATGFVAVTQAEELPVDELLEMLEALDGLFGRRPEAVVVNGVYPAGATAESTDNRSGGQLVELLRQRRAVNESQIARLLEAWTGAWLELAMLPLDRGPDLVSALSGQIAVPLRTADGR